MGYYINPIYRFTLSAKVGETTQQRVSNPVYGEITGTLMLGTPQAVKYLIERLRQKDSMMLSTITDGIHMHTVEAYSEEALADIETKLRQAGILVSERL